ncbi:MAG: substrate-binding domain-containing protein [Planctomycetes bacterium]|nr:substrate-binding domain-containing protein [Planctomycetota bacterium]
MKFADRKFSAVVFGLLLITAAFSCNKSDGVKALVFAGVPKLQNNPVFEMARRGAEAKARELNIELRWQAPREADAILQRDIVNSQAEQHVDGIFLSVNDPTVLKKAIDDAVAAGIPVMCFDADAPESKRFTCYSVDDEKTGARGAELLFDKMGGKGKVGILHGTPGAPNLEKRIVGFRRRLAEIAPDVKILEPVYCNDNTQKAIEVVKNVIQGNPDLTGFYMSGGWPLFAAPPGPFLGMEPGKITVVSFDALPAELDYVRQGYVYALTGQKLLEWGSESVRILYEWNRGKRDFPKTIDSGYDVITKENVDEYAKSHAIK